jgi:hypothetical protein
MRSHDLQGGVTEMRSTVFYPYHEGIATSFATMYRY